MKKYIFIIPLTFLFSLVLLNRCTKDPFDGIESDERAIMSFTLPEGQIGIAQITRTIDEAEALIKVIEGTDVSAVAPNIMVSYKATVTPASGEVVNFDNATNSIEYTVTSESGKTRVWTVKLETFQFDFGGVWMVDTLKYSWRIGDDEAWAWGNTNFIKDHIPDAAYEDDNTLVFNLEDVDENGNIMGTYTLDAGEDGLFADFYYVGPEDEADFSYKFRAIGPNSGTWKYDYSLEAFIFDEGTDKEYRSATPVWHDDNKTILQIPFNIEKEINWDLTYDYTQMGITATYQWWYTFVKQ